MAILQEFLYEPTVREPLVGPDGDHVAWVSTDSGRPAVHVSPIGGGEERILVRDALSGHPSSCHCWAINGKSVWLLEVPDDDLEQTNLLQVTLAGNVVTRVHLGGWSWLYGATEHGVIIDDWDRTTADSGDLYRIDPETGQREQLTKYGERCQATTVNLNGRIAFVVPDQGESILAENAVIREIDGTLTNLGDDVTPIAWEEDRLLLSKDEDDTIGVWSGGGEIDWLGAGTPIGFLDTDHVLVLRDGLPVLIPSEETLPWDGEGITAGSINAGSAAFVTDSTDKRPSQLISWQETEFTTITSPNYNVAPAEFSDPETVRYTDSAGEEREALLLLPDECPAPCLIHLYGVFPEQGDFDRKFGRPLRYLREQGYAVLLPAHGGETYSKRRHADYAKAATWVARQEWSNERVIALGHSSGGYDVLMQATHHPHPWVAGIAWNSVADFREFRDVMEKDHDWFKEKLGDKGLEQLDRVSPANKSGAVGFPLLAIQGEQDWLTFQIRDFVDEARAAGAIIEYEEIAGMGHWTQDLDLQTRTWGRIENCLRQSL